MASSIDPRLAAPAFACDPVRWAVVALTALTLVFAMASFADAKRFGGGKSFGGKSSFNKSYNKPVQQKAAPGQQKAAAGQQAQQGSRFGGMGGMLGGMLMGGLIGSMLFGGGMGGGMGMLEILLLVGGGWMLFRFLRSRQQAAAQPATAGAGPGGGGGMQYSAPQSAPGGDAAGWDRLRAEPAPAAAPAGPAMPAGMDEADFLEGAKAVYNRLQDSWDRRDLADIEEFTSPSVFAEIQRQAEADPEPAKTDILMVNARVLEVREEGPATTIAVFYDVLLREDASASEPTQAREVWHFKREAADADWKLDGIQQLEN